MTLQRLSAGLALAMLTSFVMACAAPAQSLAAQDTGTKDQEREIAWLATWKQALAEANRTEKPILLAFGKPACEGVPGMW